MNNLTKNALELHEIDTNVYQKFSSLYTLSKRQIECLFYMALGFSIKEIANTIHLSPRTIETHIKALKLKLNINLRSQLVCFFHQVCID